MNCAYCGAPMNLESRYCPHCGRPNVQAERHSRDMEHYNKEFERTRRGVYGTLRAYKGITARLILFVTAVVIMIGAFVVMNGAYGINRSRLIREAKANAAAITAQIDECIDNKDYVTISWLGDHYALTHYTLDKDDDFARYYPVIMFARNYASLYNNLVPLVTEDKPSERRHTLTYVNEDLSYLYKRIFDEDAYSYAVYDEELVSRVRDDVLELSDALLIRYLGCTPEEADGLHTMSEGKRSAFLEDKFEIIVAAREGNADE